MAITLDVPKLQTAGVCRDGQRNFRQKFGRSKTWTSLTSFERDMYQNHSVWNWDEAVGYFGLDEGDWSALADSIRETSEGESDDEDESKYIDLSNAQANAIAWARLYWAQQHPAASTGKVPDAAREYIKAVEELEQTIKFKQALGGRKPRVTCDIDGYYKGTENSTQSYINEQIKEGIHGYIEGNIVRLTHLVEARKVILEETILAEKAPAAPEAVEEPRAKLRAVGDDNG